jgi:hypothetical protein
MCRRRVRRSRGDAELGERRRRIGPLARIDCHRDDRPERVHAVVGAYVDSYRNDRAACTSLFALRQWHDPVGEPWATRVSAFTGRRAMADSIELEPAM